jgi:hypothetical protein
MQKLPIKNILVAGLVAGTLDALAAMLFFKGDPVRLWQFVASGALGRGSFDGGMMTALAGLAFHYLIATSWAFLLFVLYPRVQILSWNKFVTGILYGLFVWCAMNFLVIPLSKITPGPFNVMGAIRGALIIVFAVGLPVALLADRYYTKRKSIVHS